jgi:galactosylceramidase
MLKNLLLAVAVAGLPVTAIAQTAQPITLDGHAGGARFDGIGVVEGGGGTGVLLKDYPEPQRSQIFDLVFKPKFGASVSALYVEVPGDGNATQGSMPSHMHTRDDLNAWRGYMWWEMTEAKKRNPALTLDGAAWSAPGWIGTSGPLFDQSTGKDYSGDPRFFSQDTVDYYISWLKGVREHGLEMDAIGIRNEKGASYDFAKAFRRSLNANGFAKVKLHGFDNWPDPWKFKFVADMAADKNLRGALDVISSHNSPPRSVTPPEVRQLAKMMNKPLWDTEQHVYKAGFDGLISTVQAFNLNHIDSGYTKITDWYGIAALYTMEPYSGEKEATVRASWPWSGHYEINEKLWAYAHYGQFTQIGWSYLNGGSGHLKDGGSYVTLKSPGADYSVIIETKDATGPQTVSFRIGAGLSAQSLAVWRSNETAQFVRQADTKPVKGVVTLTLDPNAVYSLTTTRGQQKGHFDAAPDKTAFPFPYAETFDEYANPKAYGYLPRYFADIAGAFELSACPGRAGQCLHQMVPVPTISWAPDWMPYTIVGDDQWQDYEVSADIYLNRGDSAAVMGRINDVGTGYGFIPKGYVLQLSDGGALKLSVWRGKIDKKKLVGDAEQQAAILASHDDSVGGERVLGTAQVDGIAPGQWHGLKLQFSGSTVTGLVDGKVVLSVTDTLYSHGMAGLLATQADGRTSQPWFDNVSVNAVNGATPAPTAALPGQEPIYATKSVSAARRPSPKPAR